MWCFITLDSFRGLCALYNIEEYSGRSLPWLMTQNMIITDLLSHMLLVQQAHWSEEHCKHDRVLVDLGAWREDMPADLGPHDGGHHSHQQPVHQPQVQHSRSQGSLAATI